MIPISGQGVNANVGPFLYRSLTLLLGSQNKGAQHEIPTTQGAGSSHSTVPQTCVHTNEQQRAASQRRSRAGIT